MGKAAFVHLTDGVSRLQIYVRKESTKAVAGGDDIHSVLDAGDEAKNDRRELDGWEMFNLLDHGDFIGVRGHLFVTKTGELSVHVDEFEFLAKALVPMPDKVHGINDPELRARRRYADLIAGSLKVETDASDSNIRELTTRHVFERRAALVRAMRHYLDERDYTEVETPMLVPVASGAAARPFVTHHNALDITLYARIAPELYLKRLVVGGFERVYELNRNFRNEGLSTRHNPEFTMLEFYAAYMDAHDMMNTCEDILRRSIETALAGDDLMTSAATVIRWGDHTINFDKAFERLTMKQAIVRYFPDELRELGAEKFEEWWLDDAERVRRLALFLNDYETHASAPLIEAAPDDKPTLEGAPRGAMRDIIAEAWAQYASGAGDGEETADDLESNAADAGTEAARTAGYVQQIFEMVAESELIQPTFITDFPKAVSPLAKASPHDVGLAERFELYIGGMEIANGFSELNDPVEQRERFAGQQKAREQGDDEAMVLDEDYLRALSYGMPPTAGLGIGIDRVVMLITNRRSIRDVILFPHLRPERGIEDANHEAAHDDGRD
ncbi:MAG: lysine--tRNA ligase [Pyrinomonadaceae bacterium MAG19_C2-C3]|nr:lysine--tRNA ligase [Pyrinomonadaceae bacterium MAG19_C2-C3]